MAKTNFTSYSDYLNNISNEKDEEDFFIEEIKNTPSAEEFLTEELKNSKNTMCQSPLSLEIELKNKNALLKLQEYIKAPQDNEIPIDSKETTNQTEENHLDMIGNNCNAQDMFELDF